VKFALDGYRMVDFTRFQAGPVCTSQLSDMGMEVIKVETAKRRDNSRLMLPRVLDARGIETGCNYIAHNRGKKGITLDVSQPKGLELVKRLISMSDVVADNFAPGVMDNLGLNYPEIKKVKSDIVVAALAAYGDTGPYRQYVGFARPLQAHSGLIELTGYPDGPPGEPAPALGDSFLATYSAFAILVALYHRARTGEGQYIDLSMLEALVCSQPEAVLAYTMNKSLGSRRGNDDDAMMPHDTYRCQGDDEWVAIAVSDDEEWKAFCRILGRPDLDRWENEDELNRVIEEWTSNRTKYEVMEILQKAGVAAAAVMNSRDLATDPHLKERDYLKASDYDEPGKFIAGPSWKMSDTPGGIARRHAPWEGEDNEYVYGELLGLSQDEIAHLVEEKIIY